MCEYWQNVDFDILSGEISITKEYEKCEEGEQHINNIENERFNQKGVQITMQGRQERELKITSPKYGHEIYIAIGRDWNTVANNVSWFHTRLASPFSQLKTRIPDFRYCS